MVGNLLGDPMQAVEIGAETNSFHFDNETPRHRVWLDPFQLSDELISNAEYQAFIDDGGYRRPELWMSDGWGLVQQRGWNQPRCSRDLPALEARWQPFVEMGLMERFGCRWRRNYPHSAQCQ